MNFNTVKEFEEKVAEFFGAPYAVAVDCCTHGVELCLRYTEADKIVVPKRTYISIPFLADKLGIERVWKDENWKNYYYLTDTVIDAAVLWEKNSYVPGTFMNISFQFKKHLTLGRGGVILCGDSDVAAELRKMTYDGRDPDVPWRAQDIKSMGYHYYMTPETAALGLEKLSDAIFSKPKEWKISDWPDLTKMTVFKKKEKKVRK